MHFALIGITASRNATIEIVSLISRCLSQETNLTDRERDLWFRREKIRNCANFFEATSINFTTTLTTTPIQMQFWCPVLLSNGALLPNKPFMRRAQHLIMGFDQCKELLFSYLVGFKVAGISSEKPWVNIGLLLEE